jgi:hypothetical protein
MSEFVTPLSRLFQVRGRYTEPPPPRTAKTTGVRKIALVGSAPSIDATPWHDPTWEIWAHATVHSLCTRVDRYFDLHPWKWITEKDVPGYVQWLKQTKTPVYLQEQRADVVSSLRFPKERLLAEWPEYFTSHAAWMIALALSEGVTHLGFFGIHYAGDEEHQEQRPGCEFWMGVALGRGVQLVIPPDNPLLKEPKWRLYGYRSHEGKVHKRTEGYVPTPKRMGQVTVAQKTNTGRADIPRSTKRAALLAAGRMPWETPNGKGTKGTPTGVRQHRGRQ